MLLNRDFISRINILLANFEPTTKKASQISIARFTGREEQVRAH